MTFTDTFVRGRDALVNVLLGVRAAAVLNPAVAQQRGAPGSDVVAEMKRAIDTLKVAAMDPASGRIDYASLRQSREYADYRTTCSPKLQALDLGALGAREERLAFWINLYNVLIVDGVIAYGVRRSVSEGLAGLLTFFRRAAYNVGGLRFSCEDIEHGVLRANRGHPFLPGPQFGPSDPRRSCIVAPLDPRIHFALNCGARSCPPIRVYDAAQIDAQLDLATRGFLDATVAVDARRRRVSLSRIFRWYAGDFGGRDGIIDFLLRYLPDDERRRWLSDQRDRARLVYQPYDWALAS
ncbi:MAG: DUF547 domain-containing protein [Herpetosiphonaceae bacterium]|nr:MAG: DUF547 domain-containing protein [Herpetosiphonaceae bacterium]